MPDAPMEMTKRCQFLFFLFKIFQRSRIFILSAKYEQIEWDDLYDHFPLYVYSKNRSLEYNSPLNHASFMIFGNPSKTLCKNTVEQRIVAVIKLLLYL